MLPLLYDTYQKNFPIMFNILKMRPYYVLCHRVINYIFTLGISGRLQDPSCWISSQFSLMSVKISWWFESVHLSPISGNRRQ